MTNSVIPSLDGLRAVSVLLVILGHGLVPLVPAGLGVTIFFFLSGYLITTLLRLEYDQHSKIRIRDFYLRRALRILPPLYIVLLAILILNTTGIIAHTFQWGGTFASVFHLTNYWLALGWGEDLPLGAGILWSVAVEEHFYLVFPFIYIALRRLTANRRKQATVLIAICVAILAWRSFSVFFLSVGNSWAYYATDARADSILWGCVLAIAANPFLDRVRMSPRVATWVAFPLGSLAVVAVATAPPQFEISVGFTIRALALFLVFIPVIAYPDAWPGRFLRWKPLAFIGVLSYGMYLTHRLIQIPLQEAFPMPWPAVVLISLALTVGVSWLLHIWVEKPTARLRRRLVHALVQRRDDREPSACKPSSCETFEPTVSR